MAETQAAEPGQEQASTVDPFRPVNAGRTQAASAELPEQLPGRHAAAVAPAAAEETESQPAESGPPAAEAAGPEPAADADLPDAEQPASVAAEPETAEAEPAAEPDPAEVAAAEPGEVWPAVSTPVTGDIHHVELWVPNLDRAILSWGWLLTALGYRMFQDWPGGRSWRSGSAYIVVEQSPARTASRHDRCRPGLNHLAFHVETRQQVDELTAEALLHGWKLMFTDLHPFAGGPQHYAAYLENADGYEAELVAG